MSWLVFDLHGSVAGLCPAGTSALADAYRYDGWGRQVAKSGSSANPYRYRGLLNLGYDDLAGALLAMGAREYSSQLGVFTQEDSVAGGAANPATMNRFLYALANPATLIDPDGHMALAGGGGDGGYELPPPPRTPTDGLTTGGDCSRACIDALNNVYNVNTYGGGDGRWVPAGQLPADPGWHWSSTPMISGQYMLLQDECSIDDVRFGSGACPNSPADLQAKALETWVMGVSEGAVGSREYVSGLARCLATCVDSAARSRAGRLLRAAADATAFGRSPWFKSFAKYLTRLGFGIELGTNLLEKKDHPVERATLGTVGSLVAGTATVQACLGVGVPTGGIGAAACFIAVGIASWAGGKWAEEAVYGPDAMFENHSYSITP